MDGRYVTTTLKLNCLRFLSSYNFFSLVRAVNSPEREKKKHYKAIISTMLLLT